MYVNSHFTISVVFLAWLYLFRNDNFYFVRNMFMVAMGIALVGYALVPDRTAADAHRRGLHRHARDFTSVNQDSNAVSLLVNKYAAVPSMHIGFSSMIAGTAVMLVRNPLGRLLWALYPLSSSR